MNISQNNKNYNRKGDLKMTLIMCDSDCIYQKDGYCMLDGPSVIINGNQNDCVNYINKYKTPDIKSATAPQKLV